jgi:hypothetical protein
MKTNDLLPVSNESVVAAVLIKISKEESEALIKDILERKKAWKDAIREQIIQEH